MTTELTLQEKWMMAKGTHSLTKMYSRRTGEWQHIKRTPAEFKSIVKSRKNSSKFPVVEESFAKLLESLEGDNVQEFLDAFWKLEYALKFQGYLQMHIVFCEYKLKDMTEDKMKRDILVEAI